MKNLIFVLVVSGVSFMNGRFLPDDFINPTGTYILKGTLINHRIITHSGELRVKFLGNSRVAFSFFISKGSPGFESASFTDTSVYQDNEFRYHPKKCSDCTLLFSCSRRRVETQNLLKNPRSNCGFGQDVIVPAFFEKISGENPLIQDLSIRGDTN